MEVLRSSRVLVRSVGRSRCPSCWRFLSSQSERANAVVQSEADLGSQPGVLYERLKTQQRRRMLDRMLRVDHAGEIGASYMYKGHNYVLGSSNVGPVIKEMWEEEKQHLELLNGMIPKERVRPSLLQPLLQTAGYALGVGTALLGKEAAMACTEAVEDCLFQHYNSQVRELLEKEDPKNAEITQILSKLRDEELEHHNIGIQNDSHQAPFHSLLTSTIKLGCNVAIALSEKI